MPIFHSDFLFSFSTLLKINSGIYLWFSFSLSVELPNSRLLLFCCIRHVISLSNSFNLTSVDIYVFELWMYTIRQLNLYKIDTFVLRGVLNDNFVSYMALYLFILYKSVCLLKFKRNRYSLKWKGITYVKLEWWILKLLDIMHIALERLWINVYYSKWHAKVYIVIEFYDIFSV